MHCALSAAVQFATVQDDVAGGGMGISSSRFGHFAPKVGWQVTGDGWPGDAGGRASERLVTGRRSLEPAASGVLEG